MIEKEEYACFVGAAAMRSVQVLFEAFLVDFRDGSLKSSIRRVCSILS